MHSSVPVPNCSCTAKFLAQGFPELQLPSTSGLPGCDKSCVVPAVRSVMCDGRDVQGLQAVLGVEKLRDWGDAQQVAYPVPSAEPRDSLDYSTTLVARQIVPFAKKKKKSGFFTQWQLLCDFAERGAKHTPTYIPTSVFSPQFILPSLFLTSQSYWENKISN